MFFVLTPAFRRLGFLGSAREPGSVNSVVIVRQQISVEARAN